MSREIKFRAWTGKQMMYQNKQYLESFIRRVVMQVLMDHDFPEAREHESYLPKGTVIDDYLLQFTGLLDKNGKEIYEGDIVRDARWTDSTFEVKWCNGQGEFLRSQLGWILDDSQFCAIGHIEELAAHLEWSEAGREGYYNGEVIGNIYDTPAKE